MCSFFSLAIVLDYMLWPRTINASETIQQGIQIKLLVGVVVLLLSISLRKKAKKFEKPNGWIKISGVIIATVALLFAASLVIYTYTALTQ